MTIVTTTEAATVLFNVATILEMADDNPYRIRAYRQAARLMMGQRAPVDDALIEGTKGHELDLPGLGPRLRRKLGELLATGQLRFYVDLCADLPVELQQLMQIPGVGPKTAVRLHRELGLATPVDVVVAARGGRIQTLYGFGERRERQLEREAAAVLGGNVRPFVPRPPEPDPAPESAVTPLPLPLPEAA